MEDLSAESAVPGEAQTAKSRWCVLGFHDPDIHKLTRTTPTPESSSILTVLQLLASTKSKAFNSDVTTAFMQGLKHQRPEPLFARAPNSKGFPGAHPEQIAMLRAETQAAAAKSHEVVGTTQRCFCALRLPLVDQVTAVGEEAISSASMKAIRDPL